MPIVQHEPFEPINQRKYTGQRLGVRVSLFQTDPIPAELVPMVLVGDRIMDVAPISRLPIDELPD